LKAILKLGGVFGIVGKQYCCWKFKQIAKKEFGKKIQLSAFKLGPLT